MTDTPDNFRPSTEALKHAHIIKKHVNASNEALVENIISAADDDAGNAREAAQGLLKRFGSLRGVLDAEHKELTASDGVTEEAALLMRLVREMAKGYFKGLLEGRDMIGSSAMLTEYLRLLLSGERTNEVFAVYLDERNRFIASVRLDEGMPVDNVTCSGRLIEQALEHKARAAIIAINHPNGDELPTEKDTRLIEAMDRAAIGAGLIIHDHMIISDNGHFSALKNGWIIGATPHFLTRSARHSRRNR